MKSFIIMSDIVNSSSLPGGELMKDFKRVVQTVNKNNTSCIKSPLTITLGDEFQGVVKDLYSAIAIIFQLDQLILKSKIEYKLRFVVHYGAIDTAINKQNSYEMLGKGLTTARKQIEELKSTQDEIMISGLDNTLQEKLNLSFRLYRSLYNDWSTKDKSLVYDFLQGDNYRDLAGKYSKDPSSMWRKEKSLKIADFNAAKKLIELLANER